MKTKGMWKTWVFAVALVVLAEFLVGFAPQKEETVRVPVLMYHDFAEEEGAYTMSQERFRVQLAMLDALGYETITFRQLLDWADHGTALPEKPVILVSDDGYTGVLDTALPVLEEFGMCMSVAVIGALMGEEGDGEHPHFTMEELDAADSAGHIELVSHSYGLHTVTDTMRGAVNTGMSGWKYREVLREDHAAMEALFAEHPTAGHTINSAVFVYPFGAYSPESEAILKELGVRVTVTTDIGTAEVSRSEGMTLMPRIMAEWKR